MLTAGGLRFAIVAARTNEAVTSQLLGGALDCLRRHGAGEEDITVARVPGCFEIPLAAQRLAASGDHDAVICLGAVIRGATPHFEYISAEVTRGVGQVGLTTGIPTAFGVLTCDTVEQAMDRAGLKGGNKGTGAAMAAIEMVNLFRAIPGGAQG